MLLVLLPLLLVVDCNSIRRGVVKPPHTLQTSAQFVLRSIRTLRLTSFFFGLFAEKSPKHARLSKATALPKLCGLFGGKYPHALLITLTYKISHTSQACSHVLVNKEGTITRRTKSQVLLPPKKEEPSYRDGRRHRNGEKKTGSETGFDREKVDCERHSLPPRVFSGYGRAGRERVREKAEMPASSCVFQKPSRAI